MLCFWPSRLRKMKDNILVKSSADWDKSSFWKSYPEDKCLIFHNKPCQTSNEEFGIFPERNERWRPWSRCRREGRAETPLYWPCWALASCSSRLEPCGRYSQALLSLVELIHYWPLIGSSSPTLVLYGIRMAFDVQKGSIIISAPVCHEEPEKARNVPSWVFRA